MTYIPLMNRPTIGPDKVDEKNAVIRADLAFQGALERAGAKRGVITASTTLSARRYVPINDTYIRSGADF